MDCVIKRQAGVLIFSVALFEVLHLTLGATRYVPKWKKQACEIPASQNEHSHYVCDDDGEVKCLPGWTGDLCDVPKCRPGCDPMQGYCNRPGECICKLGYYGERCNKCIPLPGCQHGYCNSSFECLCNEGWDGIFCSEPICKLDCHLTRGYCDAPGECKCRIGWSGKTCKECQPLPGCQHGYCEKPLECKCQPGWTGILCQYPVCAKTCHRERGYCRKPGECRCKVGWWGKNCDKCYPYPGCVNGSCNRPWECNCRPGWGGMLCDEELNYCENNPSTCANGAKCISLTADDGNFRCLCREGTFGRNCEMLDNSTLTMNPLGLTPPKPPSKPTGSMSTMNIMGINANSGNSANNGNNGVNNGQSSIMNVNMATTPKTMLGNRTTTYIPLVSSTTVKPIMAGSDEIKMTARPTLTEEEEMSSPSTTTTEKVSIVNPTKLGDENIQSNQILVNSKGH